MELGTASLFDLPATPRVEAREPAAPSPNDELLVGIRDAQSVITEQEIVKVKKIADWALLHIVSDESAAATITERGLDTGLPVAGPGAPLISDFAVMELSALLGRSLDSGRSYIGQVLELSHRLPHTWDRLLSGDVPVWKALRIADHTRCLPMDAAAYVDRHLAPFAPTITWIQIQRLVEEALIRFDPQAAEEKRKNAAEHRGVDLGLDNVDATGIAYGTTALDVEDALDLEQAIQRRATLLGQCGDHDTLDVRRAKALGELARDDLMLDLPLADPVTGEITRVIPGRTTEIVYHLSADATLTRHGNHPLLPGHLTDILSDVSSDAKVTIRPVLDLAGHQPVDAYEIPDRLRTQVQLRDPHCVFPHCTKPAQRCDLDHIHPHHTGGPTCPCNLAPLCRGHHRMKTAHHATYQVLHPGTYHWTLPTSSYLVDPTGTHPLTTHPHTTDPPHH
ncbi:hypothetical protein [Nocardioides sp. MH1]|uniref:HNH endonuclease signature motif containing protein n=1 Tax=Nocardioides sp. MH1 TaxID=3242490 RepID=UPI003520FA35